ncbi:MAG: hypothetical protein DMG11_17490 [Acidobacteria bacterium]|nr:MAG: hypothetical protein DMG11_17490 [Acidobacteriota bacterium]
MRIQQTGPNFSPDKVSRILHPINLFVRTRDESVRNTLAIRKETSSRFNRLGYDARVGDLAPSLTRGAFLD